MRIIDNEPARDSRSRSITFAWDLQDLGDGVRERLTLTASHDSDRKCFTAGLGQEKREETPTSTRVSFEVFGGVSLMREPVARFSQKRLDDFAGEALALLRATDDERVEALFTPSDRSCGCKGMYHVARCEVYAAIAQARNARANGR